MFSGVCYRKDVQSVITAVFWLLLGIGVVKHVSEQQLVYRVIYASLLAGSRLSSTVVWYAWSSLITVLILFLALWGLFAHKEFHRERYITRRFRPQGEVHTKLAFPSESINFLERVLMDRPQPFVYPESERIEKSIEEIIIVLLNDNVVSWFRHISHRPMFVFAVQRLLRTLLINFKRRLEAIDVIGIIVRKAVPIITQHLHEVSQAELQVLDTVKTVGLDALEQSSICDAVAANSKERKLHIAAQVNEYTEDHVVEPMDNLESFLRSTIEKLLPYLVPGQDLASPIVSIFFREILACAVLKPIFSMAADPDFWNEVLVLRANQVIQERARVKRFRHVLREQSGDKSIRRSSKKKPTKTFERLMTSSDTKDWDRIHRRIQKSQSLAELETIRNDMMLLEQEIQPVATFSADPRAGLLPATAKADHFVKSALSLLEDRISDLHGKGAPLSPITSSRTFSFDRTLEIGADYFFEFLEQRQKAILLDFWIGVTRIKSDSTPTMSGSQLSILDSTIHLSKQEIRYIYDAYFSSPLLTVTDEERRLVENYLNNEPELYDIDSNEIIINVAHRAYKMMEIEDYPDFCADKLYERMLIEVGHNYAHRHDMVRTLSDVSSSKRAGMSGYNTRNASSIDLLGIDPDNFANETMGLVDTSEKDVLEAMEDALHSSLTYSGTEQSDSLRNPIEMSDHDHDGALFMKRRSVNVSRRASISVTDIKTAEPGNLNLVEEIALLDQEIQKRRQSLHFIEKFLNSQRAIDETDRKIVIKSRIQTTRELEKYLTQKQQYEADDHSLYGRSSVVIDQSTTHHDLEGNEYTVYVIEVRRAGFDGIQAGWIITRRYSEFNELHTQLKQRFPQVGNLDFPKKQLNRLKSVADARRPILESFLQSLLKDERICKSSELRNFLSQNNLTVKKRTHKSVLENLIGLTDPRESLSRLFTMLESPDELRLENPDLRKVHPAPNEPPDEVLSSFAKPIVDLVLEAFDLREKSKWIKKKAVVLVLQQILGGTIESRVRDQVSSFLEERSFLTMLGTLKDRLTKPPGTSRTVKSRAERQRLMELARETLRAYNPPYVPEGASKKVFRALQIRTLNMHLLGKITDSLVDAIFVSSDLTNKGPREAHMGR